MADEEQTQWETALSWLGAEDEEGKQGHTTTASETSQLEAYIQRHAAHLTKKNEHGGLPVHYVAAHQRGEHAVTAMQALLTAFPKSARKNDNIGFLPLHIAAEFQTGEHGLAVVMALIRVYPKGIHQRTNEKWLPLHVAAEHQAGKHGLAVVKALLSEYPTAAKAKDSDGCLPLHRAVRTQRGVYGLAVVAALLDAYPHAAQETDNDGCLPLHFAANNQKGDHAVAVVETLLRAYPQAIQQKPTDPRWLPLHCAAYNQRGKHGLAVVTTLLNEYPEGIHHKDADGDLPLHLAVLSLESEVEQNAGVDTDRNACAAADTDTDTEARTHLLAVLLALLTAYPRASQEQNNQGLIPLQIAQRSMSPAHEVVKLLEAAAEDGWRPPAPDTRPSKLVSAYNDLSSAPRMVGRSTPVKALMLEQVEYLCRRAQVLVQHSNGHADPLAKLASAASVLSSEDCIPVPAATLLQAAPLLCELLTAAQAPYTPVPALQDLQTLSTAAEKAIAHLRACQAAILSRATLDPPPAAVDVALIFARDAALSAADSASRAFSDALSETNMDAISAASKTTVDEVNILLHRATVMTGMVVSLQADAQPSPSSAGSAPLPTVLTAAMAQLDSFSADFVSSLARLPGLHPVNLLSLGNKDTNLTRTALETMQEVTHALLTATDNTSLIHYLTFDGPWKAVCTALAARRATLCTESDVVSGFLPIAAQLRAETLACVSGFAEREAKVERLECAHKALRKARKALHNAKGAASSDDESEGEMISEQVHTARRACRQASKARDAAVDDLFSSALAFYPEVLVQQSRRLAPGGLPAIISQRSQEDYDDIEPLERATEGRHLLFRANFDGEACVLKAVPLTTGSVWTREAGILKLLKHPNIVPLLAVFVENKVAYLHMPYASHGDMNHFLTVEAAAASSATTASATELPVRQLQRLARQLCEAVVYLAERSIVHCDVKLANVFVDGKRHDDSLRVVVGDFDVSQTAASRTTTLTRAVVGAATHYTPGYAPPEVLHAPAGQPACASPAIDVYGLGCVIFAMHMFPRTLPEPSGLDDAVTRDAALFSPAPLRNAATPAVAAWAASVPRDVVQAATSPQPLARASARELLHTRYMLDASGSFAHVAIQRPAYWLHQTHTGSWLEEETSEAVRLAVEKLLNATADRSTHGTGRDSHKTPFQEFKVTRVQRLEHPAVWSAYAAHRRQVADALMVDGYNGIRPLLTETGIRPLLTETDGFVYPLEGGSLDAAAGEVFLFHGSGKPASIANSGFDVRYAFAGAGRGASFGRGVYFAESASKADQYVGRDGTRPLTMVVARVLLGCTAKVTTTRSSAPFLPEVEGKSTAAVPVYYDSLVADRRPQGMRFREVVIGEGTRAYPELFVEYERV